MNPVFKIKESVMREVEEAVQKRIQERCLADPLSVSDSLPIEEFYNKILAYRRRKFDRISSPRNLYLLRQAIYACHYISTSFDDMRVFQYNERNSNA